jgi:nucleoid-associated protein YgaU
MTIASKAGLAAVSLLLVAACTAAAFVFGPSELRRMLPLESRSEVKAEASAEAKTAAHGETSVQAKPGAQLAAAGPPVAVAPAAAPEVAKDDTRGDAKSDVKDDVNNDSKSTLAAKQAQATAALADLAPSAPLAAEEPGPHFDVARIGESGEAVIAGRAAPGAKVDLLRDGESLDSVVADASGQFVMVPPRLPSGNYQLRLRARSPDGTTVLSRSGVPVALNETALPARAAPRTEVAAAGKPEPRQGGASPPAGPAPAAATAPEKDAALSRAKPTSAMAATAATTTSSGPSDASTGAIADPRTNRIVSRGDSLWNISRLAYGDGSRYELIFKANRDKIRNPDLIYPGQTFLLPRR